MSLESFLKKAEIAPSKIEAVLKFYELVCAENEVQNLTRLISPHDFFEGHVLDCLELIKSGFLEYPTMDLGSGCGVPGVLCAILDESSTWILAESESNKAVFLEETVEKLDLSDRVRVFSGRAEAFLKSKSVKTVVSRAVGKVEKIFTWIGECSTWNKLILLKGPAWSDEWNEFGLSKFRGKLKTLSEHQYIVGQEAKKRSIIELIRT